MVQKDHKKIENAQERHEIAKLIVTMRKYKGMTAERRERIIKDCLTRKKETQTNDSVTGETK